MDEAWNGRVRSAALKATRKPQYDPGLPNRRLYTVRGGGYTGSMSSEYDATEFVDGDLQSRKSPYSAASVSAGQAQRARTREETEADLVRTQQELAAIMRQKEEKEREKAALEETRRRQTEFQTGRQEMIENLTRGLGLLEEAEFSARRDAEQMAKTVTELRDALNKVQGIHEEAWTENNFPVELTRALTTLENARMEWNGARLKFPVLSGQAPSGQAAAPEGVAPVKSLFATYSFGELCRLGFALTWPLAGVALVALAVLVAVLLRH